MFPSLLIHPHNTGKGLLNISDHLAPTLQTFRFESSLGNTESFLDNIDMLPRLRMTVLETVHSI